MPKFTIKEIVGNRARTTTGEIIRVPVNNRPAVGGSIEVPETSIVPGEKLQAPKPDEKK